MKKLEFEVPIYTFQIDYVGHVSNIVYIQWMEIGRTRFLEEIGLPVEEMAQAGVAPVLTSTHIEYRQSLYLGDRVRIEVWISELRHASARIEFRFYKNGDLLAATGSQKGLFVHRDTMRPHRMSHGMRAAFEAYLAAGDEAAV